MKSLKIAMLLLCLSIQSASAQHPVKKVDPNFKLIAFTGIASWYGPGFHGRRTASGERYDMNGMSCAHKSLPLGLRLRITNLANNKSVVVKLNDRGPYIRGRSIDLSKGAAKALGSTGLIKVRVSKVEPEPKYGVPKLKLFDFKKLNQDLLCEN